MVGVAGTSFFSSVSIAESSLALFLALALARAVVERMAVATFSISFTSGGFVTGGYANADGRMLETNSNFGI